MKILLMADGSVGLKIVSWLVENYPEDLSAVVVTTENDIFSLAKSKCIPTLIFRSEEDLVSKISIPTWADLGILAWWPKLVSSRMLSSTRLGFINTHPSLLPHNRGKHYNFWALIEQAPFGVSLHFVDEGIDSGDVIAQSPIFYDWEDTGESLYLKAQEAMFALFTKEYPRIREGSIVRTKQDLAAGSVHYSEELTSASEIKLDKQYLARDLFNLLRARTFPGKPGCYFEQDGETFEVRINIKRKME